MCDSEGAGLKWGLVNVSRSSFICRLVSHVFSCFKLVAVYSGALYDIYLFWGRLLLQIHSAHPAYVKHTASRWLKEQKSMHHRQRDHFYVSDHNQTTHHEAQTLLQKIFCVFPGLQNTSTKKRTLKNESIDDELCFRALTTN